MSRISIFPWELQRSTGSEVQATLFWKLTLEMPRGMKGWLCPAFRNNYHHVLLWRDKSATKVLAVRNKSKTLKKSSLLSSNPTGSDTTQDSSRLWTTTWAWNYETGVGCFGWYGICIGASSASGPVSNCKKQILVSAINHGLVHAVIKTCYRSASTSLKEELVQEGSLGLLRSCLIRQGACASQRMLPFGSKVSWANQIWSKQSNYHYASGTNHPTGAFTLEDESIRRRRNETTDDAS